MTQTTQSLKALKQTEDCSRPIESEPLENGGRESSFQHCPYVNYNRSTSAWGKQ